MVLILKFLFVTRLLYAVAICLVKFVSGENAPKRQCTCLNVIPLEHSSLLYVARSSQANAMCHILSYGFRGESLHRVNFFFSLHMHVTIDVLEPRRTASKTRRMPAS